MQQLTLFHDENLEIKFQKRATALASLMTMTRSSMNRVAKKHPVLSRDLIADLMTEISRSSGVKLSSTNSKRVQTATLEKWITPGERDHPPKLEAIAAFVMATGDNSPLLPLLNALGLELMTEEDKKYRDYGLAVIRTKEAQQRKKQLEAKL